MVKQLVIVYGGELAKDVAQQIAAKKPAGVCTSSSSNDIIEVSLRSAAERPKTLVDLTTTADTDTTTVVVVCFVMQTIENAAPTEEGASCVGFFKRKTHPESLLAKDKFSFTVLGLGDSNLLLDRQTTSAKDCNQVAQELDSRLAALGGKRCYDLGMADERTGLQEVVEPWIDGFWNALVKL